MAQRIDIDDDDARSAAFERKDPALDVVANRLIADADVFGGLFDGQVVVCVFHVSGPCASDARRRNRVACRGVPRDATTPRLQSRFTMPTLHGGSNISV